jgi:hypothetical protein
LLPGDKDFEVFCVDLFRLTGDFIDALGVFGDF